MLSNIPIDLSKVGKADLNKEILRAAIIAELDAVRSARALNNCERAEKPPMLRPHLVEEMRMR